MSLPESLLFPSLKIILQNKINEIYQLPSFELKNYILIRISAKLSFFDTSFHVTDSFRKRFLNALNQKLVEPISATIEDEIIIRSNIYLTKLAIDEITEEDLNEIHDFIKNWVQTKKNLPFKFGIYLFNLLIQIRKRFNYDLRKDFDILKKLHYIGQDQTSSNFLLIFEKIFYGRNVEEDSLEIYFEKKKPELEEKWVITEIHGFLNANIQKIQRDLFYDSYKSFTNILENILSHERSHLSYQDFLVLETLINLSPCLISYHFADSTLINLFGLSGTEKFLSDMDYISSMVYELFLMSTEILNRFIDPRYNRLVVFLLHNALEICCKHVLKHDIRISQHNISQMSLEVIINRIKEKRKTIQRNGKTFQQHGFNSAFFEDIHRFREIRNDLQHKGAGLSVDRQYAKDTLLMIVNFCDIIFEKEGSKHIKPA